jgi:hypothetical protein
MILRAADLRPGVRFRYNGHPVEILRSLEKRKDRFGLELDSWWSRRIDTGDEGYVSLGPGGVLRVEPLKTPRAQIKREIAASLAGPPTSAKRKDRSPPTPSKRQLLLWIPFASKGSMSIARPIPVNFTAKEVDEVWTLTSSRDPSITPVLPLHPVHGHGAFLEDYGHDWTVRAGNFIYRSRITDQPAWVMVQLK